jgi:hypothetical protein
MIVLTCLEPPELEILEIGDLTTDRFRGIFRLKYAGDASIELKTQIQVGFVQYFIGLSTDSDAFRPIRSPILFRRIRWRPTPLPCLPPHRS